MDIALFVVLTVIAVELAAVGYLVWRTGRRSAANWHRELEVEEKQTELLEENGDELRELTTLKDSVEQELRKAVERTR